MNVLLINLPPERGKRAHFGLLSFQRYTNYGLLSLGSHLHSCGHFVRIFDFQAPLDDPERELDSILREQSWDAVGFSCISGFSYPSLERWSDFARVILGKRVAIVVGGQDHVGKIPAYVLAENHSVDFVVTGPGEVAFIHLLEALERDSSANEPIPGVYSRLSPSPVGDAPALLRIPSLNYSLYPLLRSFPASVEFARGCPYACSFCVSAHSGFLRRPPHELVQEIQNAVAAYNMEDLPVYLEAPIFIASRQYMKDLKSAYREAGLRVTWRTEARVDTIRPEDVPLLYASGLRVLDLGLESAAPSILRTMRKTSNPNEYLSRASALLTALSDHGILPVVNVLLYAGETQATFSETRSFLELHRPSVAAVSAYPLLLYPGIEGEARILNELRSSGGSRVDSEEWQRRHLIPLNLSESVPYSVALTLAHDLEREFQDSAIYFRLRRYGYFAPQTTYDEFNRELSTNDLNLFPFRTPPTVMD